jgi:hypothetical protein
MHLVKDEDHSGGVLVRCGRVLPPHKATLNPRQATCRRCLESFAKMLRELPDVFPADKTLLVKGRTS